MAHNTALQEAGNAAAGSGMLSWILIFIGVGIAALITYYIIWIKKQDGKK